MKKKLATLAATVMLFSGVGMLALASPPPASAAKQEKIAVNHNGVVICIAVAALAAHLAHGDSVHLNGC